MKQKKNNNKIKHLIKFGEQSLLNKSASAKLDAELLLCFLLKTTKEKLIINTNNTVNNHTIKEYQKLIKRRSKGEPIAYIIGKKEFYSLTFIVTKDTLVPRWETEMLVDIILEKSSQIKDKLNILELGTGSGCISIALAKELIKKQKKFSIIATDISIKSLLVAKKNSTIHNVEKFIEFKHSNWYKEVPANKKFNIIVSNPPYLSFEEKLPVDLSYEPATALFSKDKNGIREILQIAKEGANFLANNGYILCEIGDNQKKMLLEKLTPYFKSIEFKRDLANKDRVLLLRYPK